LKIVRPAEREGSGPGRVPNGPGGMGAGGERTARPTLKLVRPPERVAFGAGRDAFRPEREDFPAQKLAF